jgi:hypothetical protein
MCSANSRAKSGSSVLCGLRYEPLGDAVASAFAEKLIRQRPLVGE